MLTEICAHIKNYFTYEADRHNGEYAIVNGAITPSFLIPTDYIRIVGSHKNDGVHKLSDNDLIDEDTFEGAIWVMSPPRAFLDLVDEIEAWQEKNGSVNSQAMSPFASESFGGYSYTKGSNSGSSGGSGLGTSWQNAYGTRLNAYRRIRV